jgi:hypothetical protein
MKQWWMPTLTFLKCLMTNLFLISNVWRTWRRSGTPTVRILLHHQSIIRICTSVTSSVGKSSKNHKGSNIWFYYSDKNNHNTADCRAISKFKQQKKACFEAKLWPFCFLFVVINALKRQLKPKKTAGSKKRKDESILST